MQTDSVNNSVVVEPLTQRYKLRFDDNVEAPSYYRFELEALEQAGENDHIQITTNSIGGRLDTGIEVTNAIANSKAHVHGILRSSCHSCGSIIFLACTTHEVGIASEMLLHSGEGGSVGTPSQSVKRAESYKRQVRTLFETVYSGFLTEEELDQLIEEDKEFIFGSQEISERLENMYSHRNKVTEEALLKSYEEEEEQCSKFEDLLLNTLVDKRIITEEEARISRKVQAEALALDEEHGEELLQTLNKSKEEGSLCTFTAPEESETVNVSIEKPSGHYVICVGDDEIILDDFLLPEDELRDLCNLLGIKYSHNIGYDTLFQRLVDFCRNETGL